MSTMFTLYVVASRRYIAKDTYVHVFPALHEHDARRQLLDWYLANKYHVHSISTERKEVKRRKKRG